ncbi:dTDP-4-dehydrorhamnose reductase [Lacimicrobium alkaliphilum]|uniref:dTDP-4-dehydrorhamnose reductase n=1 Tax=Lacimicrobium alkaliphilum TaxID=1526571 RepID=UPI002FF9F6AF
MNDKILVIGRNGQLAKELAGLADSAIVGFLGREQVNLSDYNAMADVLSRFSPAAIINASAYTAVDLAEQESQQAYQLNHHSVENLARFAKTNKCHLVHVSTDYVFAGDKGSPYKVDDPHNPQGVYGASKAAGEKAILEHWAKSSCIVRTSWVYSRHGNNFVKTMLRLMKEKPELNVIDDQVGTPTSVTGLAACCLQAARDKVCGVHHYTDAGVASWYDFAVAIQDLALQSGLLNQAIPVNPIPTTAYPTPAKRPHYSVLDKSTLKGAFKGCS